MARLTVGLEHERHVTINGVTVPAFVLFPHFTKQNPFTSNGGTVHWDNALVEFTTAPCNTPENLSDEYYRILYVAKELVDSRSSYNNFVNWCDIDWIKRIPQDYTNILFSFETASFYKPDAVMASPEMTALGCDPSRNAYGERPIRPEGYADTWRYGGCHVNFSTDNLSGSEIRNLIKAMIKLKM